MKFVRLSGLTFFAIYISLFEGEGFPSLDSSVYFTHPGSGNVVRHVLKKVIRSVLASYDASHALVVSLLCPNFRHFLKDLSTLRSPLAV